MDLFPAESDAARQPRPPLAERMRPQTLDEFVGQEHLVGEGRFLSAVLTAEQPPSLIFWGPPGSGKTTLAHLIARATRCRFVFFSAVLSGVKEVRELVAEARERKHRGERTILFVDEIHRFNRSQKDAFLPHVEDGTIILMGATTENPSFEINAPLLSRCKVLTLKPLPGTEHAAKPESIPSPTTRTRPRERRVSFDMMCDCTESEERCQRAVNSHR